MYKKLNVKNLLVAMLVVLFMLHLSSFHSALSAGEVKVLDDVKIELGFERTNVIVSFNKPLKTTVSRQDDIVMITFCEPVRCKDIRRVHIGAKGIVKKIDFFYKGSSEQALVENMVDALGITVEELEDMEVISGKKFIRVELSPKVEDLGIGRSKERLMKKEGKDYALIGRDYGILQDIDLNIKHDRIRVTIALDKPIEFTDLKDGDMYILAFKTPVKDHHLKLPKMREKDGIKHIAKIRNREDLGWKRGKLLDALHFDTSNISECYAWAEGEVIIIDMFYAHVPEKQTMVVREYVEEWGDSRYVLDVDMDVLSDRTRAVFSLNKLFNYTVLEDDQPDTITIKFESPVQSSLPMKHIRGKGDIKTIYFLDQHLKPVKNKKRESIIGGILIKTPGPAFSDVYNDGEKNMLVVDVVSFSRALEKEFDEKEETLEEKTPEEKVLPKIGKKVKFKALVNQAWIDDIKIVNLRRFTGVFLKCNKGIRFQIEEDETDKDHLKVLVYFNEAVRSKLQKKDWRPSGVISKIYPIYKEETFVRDLRIYYQLLEAIGIEVDRVLSYTVIAERDVIAIKFMHPDIFNRQGLFADYVEVNGDVHQKTTWEGGDLTLEKALELAVENNYTILKAKTDIEKARGVIAETLAKKFPKFNMSAEYVVTADSLLEDVSATDYLNFGDGVFGSLAEKFVDLIFGTDAIQYGNQNVFNIDFRMTQMLYAGGRILGPIKVAKLLEKVAAEFLFIAKEEVVFNVKRVFYQVILNRDLIDLNKNTFSVLQKKLKIRQDEFQQKVASANDILEMQVEVEEHRPKILMAENRYKLAKDNLRFLIGVENVPVTIKGELAFQPADISLEHAMEVALRNRPEILIKKFLVRTTREKVKMAQGGYLPTVMAFGDYVVRSSSFTVEGDKDDYLQGWIAGVRAEVPIFDTIETKGRVRQADAEYKKAVLGLKELENQIRIEVQEAYWKVREAEASVIPELKKVQLSEEKLKLASSRYERGEATPLEVESMEVVLFKTKIGYLQSLYQLEMLKAGLHKVMGIGYIERNPVPEFSPYYNTSDNFERTY